MQVEGNIPCTRDCASLHVLWLVHQLGEDYPGPHKYTHSFGVPLGHLKENYRLTQG